MFQDAQTQPTSDQPSAIEPTTKRRYRKRREWPPDVMAAIVTDRIVHKMSWVALGEKYDAPNSVIQRALTNAPKRPVRGPDESKQKFGVRVKAWMMHVDPEYRAHVSKNMARAVRLSWKRRKRAMERPADPLPPPVNIEAAQPIAATQPAATITAAPRVGFWRALGMMLGFVR